MSSHAARVHHLGAQDFHTNWDQARPPRLVIDPGDTVIFETMEASGGAIARMVAGGTKTLGDPAIIAAAPGDTLVVRSEAVTVGSWGWTSCSPEGNGLPQHEVPEHTLYLWNLREPGRAPFAPRITAPLAPFRGVMGVAPAEAGLLSTLPPRTTGGNLDVRALGRGHPVPAGPGCWGPLLGRRRACRPGGWRGLWHGH